MVPGMIAAARRRSVASADPSFSSVKLLMGFEGTNGSTSFVDESSAPHTLTANGNAQITTSQFKFGSSSGAFDGSGDFITAPDSADWDFGSGNFTIEGFFRFLTKQDSQAMIGQWDNAGTFSNSAWFLYINGGQLMLRRVVGSTTFDVSAAFAPTLGTWYHIAVDRDSLGPSTRIYVNGAKIARLDSSTTPNNSTNVLSIGRIGTGTTFSSFDFNGNMDELRITKGVARYASDAGFTVPSSAYPRS